MARDNKISSPPQELNGGCIETALHSHLIGLHLLRTSTAEHEARITRREVYYRGVGPS